MEGCSLKEAKTILIAGPTASGKSDFALRLAQERRGTIINADSMQVYVELRLLTARPGADEEARVPHALYGHVPSRDAYSVARFLDDAAVAIARARAEGRVPIIVGGTGLYFNALLQGLSPIPVIDDDVRARWRNEADRVGAPALHCVLADRDSVMAARLTPSDTQRIVRALEVIDQTGRSLAEWQEEQGTPVLDADTCEKFVIEVDRDELHARADARFDRIMAAGALDEVRTLRELGLPSSLPAMRAIGVAPLLRALGGALPIADAVAAAKGDTRRYIKRQQTWLKRHMITWNRIKT